MAVIVPPAPIDNPNFTSYTWVDWYQKVRNAINEAQIVNWSAITGKPTTIVGFGITDAPYLSSGTLIFPSAVGNGAGASIGTLNNAPAATNPTRWIPIDDAGTTRYIPAW
jgi:hypothetical protein